MALVSMGVLQLHKNDNQAIKLKKIFEKVLALIDEHHPDELAIEAPFFGKNVQSMLKLGRAQGVAIAAALSRGLPIFEYSPRKIKQSITGQGGASKEQVALMSCKLLDITEIPAKLDATDGLAAAICHFFQRPASAGEKNFTSWKAFMRENPEKIK